MATETFSIDKRPLRELLGQVGVGKIQLPEFQRGWVWPWPNIGHSPRYCRAAAPGGEGRVLVTRNAWIPLYDVRTMRA